jgi:hypothetical protein
MQSAHFVNVFVNNNSIVETITFSFFLTIGSLMINNFNKYQ